MAALRAGGGGMVGAEWVLLPSPLRGGGGGGAASHRQPLPPTPSPEVEGGARPGSAVFLPSPFRGGAGGGVASRRKPLPSPLPEAGRGSRIRGVSYTFAARTGGNMA